MTLTYKHTLYTCYLGYITQAIVINLAPILFIVFQDKFLISFEMIGRLVVLNFGTQIIVDAIAVRYADRIGMRPLAVIAHLAAAMGLVLLGVLPNIMPSPYTGLVIAVIVYAIGGGLIEVLISPIVDALPGDAKDSAMSLLHSFYSWGQVAVVLLSTLYIRLFSAEQWYVLPILWAIIPAFNIINFLRVPLMPIIPEHARLPLKRLLTSRIFVLAMILMVAGGASELSMSQWASLFAEKGLGIPKFIGDLLGPLSFAAFMGVGRVAYGIWGERLDLRKALIASSVLCIACYGVTVFVQQPLIALAGCALCGLSVSMMWPGMLRMASKSFPMGGTAMFAVLAIMGDVGGSVGPWITGAVSDIAQVSQQLVQLGAAAGLSAEQIGLRTGLLAAAVFPVIMLIGVLLFRVQARQRNYPDVQPLSEAVATELP